MNLHVGNEIKELVGDEPQGYYHLKSAFKENVIENTGLEQLRFNGIYDKIVELVTGRKQDFYVGVQGNIKRTFDLYLKGSEEELIKIKTYVGQAELDYTLWTTDSVFLFEAKKAGTEGIKRYF